MTIEGLESLGVRIYKIQENFSTPNAPIHVCYYEDGTDNKPEYITHGKGRRDPNAPRSFEVFLANKDRYIEVIDDNELRSIITEILRYDVFRDQKVVNKRVERLVSSLTSMLQRLES